MQYGLLWRSLRHRRGQAIALGVLAGLVVAACTSGPLYERAVEQASVRATFNQAQPSARGITLDTKQPFDAAAYHGQLADGARLFGTPQYGTDLANVSIQGKHLLITSFAYRSDACAHVILAAGRCATATNEVVLSRRFADAVGLTAGATTKVSLVVPGAGPVPYPGVHVVGLYEPPTAARVADEYWFGRDAYFPGANILDPRGNSDDYTASDAMFTTADTVAKAIQAIPPNAAVASHQYVDAPLAVTKVGLDQLPLLRRTIGQLEDAAAPDRDVIRVETDLPSLLTGIDKRHHIARTIVPLLAGQLALAALIVLVIAMLSAAEHRRPELALARLRGRTRASTAGVFVREVIVAVLAGLVLGAALAWFVAQLACHRWLLPGIHPELRWPVVVAAPGSAVIAILGATAIALRTAAQPVGAMLRQVPPRRSRIGLGVVEAALGALTVAGIVIIESGSRDNPVAVLTPSLIGLLAGLIVGRVLVRVAPAVGRRALWRGRVGPAMAAFQLARRPGARLAITLLCLATALAVFAADAWTVSARNRSARAGLTIGAPVVLHVQASSVSQLQDAVRAADPSGRYATPVIIQQPPGVGAEPVVAVDPAPFARIAHWGWPSDRPSPATLAKLDPPRPAPIILTGTNLQVRMGAIHITDQGPRDPYAGRPALQPVWLRISLRRNDGSIVGSDLGPLVDGSTGTLLSDFVSCAAGCRLASLGLQRSPTDNNAADVDATIDSIADGGKPVDLGQPNDWASVTAGGTAEADPNSMSVERAGPGGLRLQIHTDGNARVQHLDVPVAIPALVSGPVPDARDDLGNITTNNVDARAAAFANAGPVPLVPRQGTDAMLVDLNVAGGSAGSISDAVTLGLSDPMVWLGRDSTTQERALTATLAAHGVHVTSRDTITTQRKLLTATAPAWSMQVAITTGIIAALIAAVLLVMGTVATRRSRRQDFTSLRLVGTTRTRLRRSAITEQLAIVITSVLVGTTMGVLGAHLAMPSIPIFVDQQPVPPIRLPIAWPSVLIAAGSLLVLLGATAVLTALRLTRPHRRGTGERR